MLLVKVEHLLPLEEAAHKSLHQYIFCIVLGLTETALSTVWVFCWHEYMGILSSTTIFGDLALVVTTLIAEGTALTLLLRDRCGIAVVDHFCWLTEPDMQAPPSKHRVRLQYLAGPAW